MIRQKLLIICLLFSLVSSQISFGGPPPETEENKCTTPDGKEGECIGLRRCNNILVLLRKPIATEAIKYLRASVCSFSGFLPDVCCPPDPVTFGGSATTTTTSTSTTTSTTTKTTTTTTTTPSTTKVPVIDGKWSDWGPWGSCSKTCGGGTQKRSRACNSPPPSPNGGAPCEGEDEDTRECGDETCPSSVAIPPECGITKVRALRITNGRPALNGQWPWQVALGYTNPTDNTRDYLCGGALVTKRHVVTAAHCLRDDMVTVLLGEYVLHNDTDGASPEEFKIIKKSPHEAYNARTFDNDIAVITFDSDVGFRDGIQPICLPSATPGVIEERFAGSGTYVTGWGAKEFRGPTSNTLLQALIQVTSQDYCTDKFSQFSNVQIDDTKICARDVNAQSNSLIKDACQGDSGGPLMLDRRGEDGKFRYHLVGVVSFGFKCAVPGFPGVYTRITEYDEWIKETIAKDVF